MGYTTLGQMLSWLEQPTGLTVRDNRQELVEIANDVRREMFNMYQDVPLFLDAEECFEIKKFPRDCNNCDESYLGFTLNEGMQTPEASWVNSSPVAMYSKWRSTHVGLPPGAGNDCKLEMHDVGAIFPTQMDLPLNECHHLKVMTDSAEDEAMGESVTLNFKNDRNELVEEHLLLKREYVRTEQMARALATPGGVRLPHGLCGAVRLALDDGTIIAEYAPWQVVPAFRRMQVLGVCEGDHISVRAAREFVPLYFDYDVVETDNKRALVNGALYLRYNDSVNTEPGYAEKATGHFLHMQRLLLGEKSRDFGKGTVRKHTISEGCVQRSGLNSKQYGRIRHYGRISS